jgi:uncharacterized protein YndB with AHSA1/START domain
MTQRDRKFEHELEIAAPRDAVWEAIATDAGLRRWFATEARVVPGIGGEVMWKWAHFHTWTQTIEVWEPGRRLRTRYDSSVDDGRGGKKPLFIEFDLRGEGGRTTLRVVQSGFGPESGFDAEYDGISQGWPVELRSLKLSLERHRNADRAVAWSTIVVALSPDEAWKRLTSRNGLSSDRPIDALREGEPFEIRSASGDTFTGHALAIHPREFSGIAQNHGDGWLRIWAGRHGAEVQIWLWVATWGGGAAGEKRAKELEARWSAMLAKLFAAELAGAKRG